MTKLSVVNPQFNSFPTDNELRPHFTYAPHGWDLEFDATQNSQAQEPSLTNLSVVNLQFNNEHRPYSTHAPHGWDPEFDVTQELQGQDHGIDDTHVPVDRMLDNNEVQTIGMYVSYLFML